MREVGEHARVRIGSKVGDIECVLHGIVQLGKVLGLRKEARWRLPRACAPPKIARDSERVP